MRFKDGKALPATDEAKIKQAVLEGANADKAVSEGFAVWPESVDIVENTKEPLDKEGRFRYRASGSTVMCFRHLKDDELHPKKSFNFNVVFEDSSDDLGLPDIKVIESSYLKV